MKVFYAMTGAIPCRAHNLSTLCVVLLCVFFALGTAAQNLDVQVTATPETCTGNGSLSFTATNAAATPAVNFKVYKLPDTSTAIYDNTGNTAPGLTDGDYLVVATQTVNGVTSTGQAEATITDNIAPLTYQLNGIPSTCVDGMISVNVTSGNPATYEILTGPVTTAPQSETLFTGLPAGVYTVRVIDDCGTGIVKTVTVLSAASILNISGSIFPDIQLPDCDHITIAHQITPADADIPVVLPITATFVLYPPGGGDSETFTTTAVSIAPGIYQVSVIVPFYYDTNYYYDVTIVDGCGNTYDIPHNLIRQKLTVVSGFDNAGCGEKFLYLNPYKFVAPYEIVFTETPEDFDPYAMNAEHPGPFYGNQVTYGGEGNPVPYGIYTFTMTDECGRSETISIELEEFEPEAIVAVFNSDCVNNLGGTKVSVPGFVLIGGEIIDGPAEYTDNTTLPFDLSGHINDQDMVEIWGLPPGTYQFEVLDDCGNIYPAEVIIPDFTGGSVSPISRPDCTPGMGTLRVGGGYTLTSAKVTVAPPEFNQTLPFDASSYISDTGTLYMDNLPPGPYKVKVTTDCTGETEVSSNVPAYVINSSEVEVTRHCGSFDVSLNHDSNAAVLLSFWLQKLVDPVAGKWGNPSTNVIYTTGIPTETDSKKLNNFETLYTVVHTGQYRVLKVFQTFGSGEPTKLCVEILDEFEFYDDLQVPGVASLSCAGDTADIQVEAIGAEPLLYRIEQKNGQPFVVDNGNNNIFLGLETATYTVMVYDPCGNQQPFTFSVADLPSLVNATSPGDLLSCDSDFDGAETFDLSVLDASILDGQSTDNVTLTYHATLSDANQLINPLPDTVTANLGVTQIYARVTHNLNEDCMAITAFDLEVRPMPELNMRDTWSMCEGTSVVVTADAGFAAYLWSTGETTRSITVTEPGMYSVAVENQYGCSTEMDITVIESFAPAIREIEIEDWTDSENIITVLLENVESPENFEYSLDAINYQDSNTFTGLEPGHYNVFVRDKYGCGMTLGDTYLLTYPKFFTPNGDTINDYWRIAFSMAEPDMHVYIFDRYGKVITTFGANSEGWDGTYNGAKLPSTDYWFVVTRQNGKEYKGHFSMIR